MMTSMLMQGDSCAVSMDGVNMSGPAKRAARLRLYQFMMVIIILVVAFHAVALFIPW
jgi:t-SNARE complex subunit (syntaxin)